MRTIETLIEERTPLDSVEYERDEHQVWRTRLRFGDATFVIGVDEDTDAIMLSEQAAPRDPIADVSNKSPWRLATGKPLFSVWRMTNDKGADDGLQLSFAETARDAPTIIQLIAIGSALHVFLVQRTDSIESNRSARRL